MESKTSGVKRGACAHADIKADKRGRVVMRANTVWPCLCPIPDLPALPMSVTQSYGYRWPPPRRHVDREDCAECPCWTERKATA